MKNWEAFNQQEPAGGEKTLLVIMVKQIHDIISYLDQGFGFKSIWEGCPIDNYLQISNVKDCF